MVLSRLFEAPFNHWLANHWLTSIKEWLTSISDVMMVMSSHNAPGGMTFSGLPRLSFFSIKMATPKRERSDNFTVKQMSVIAEAFKDHREKLQSNITNKKKQEISERIAHTVNAVESQNRTTVQIKNKWTNLVRIAKKVNSRITKEKKKTGGESPPKPPACSITANVMEMFSETVQFDGLIGSETSVDRKSG